MNAADRVALDAIPVPVANGEPGRACVVYASGGWTLAWLVGTEKQPIAGLRYGAVRAAADASRHLNARAAP